MPKPYLIGSVSRTNVDPVRRLSSTRPGAITFGEASVADLATSDLSWSETGNSSRIEQLEAVILLPDFGPIPSTFQRCPSPVIAIAGAWRENWHRYCEELTVCDVILTDSLGAFLMREAGLNQACPSVAPWSLRSVEQTGAEKPEFDLLLSWESGSAPRDLGKWVGACSTLRDRWRVHCQAVSAGAAFPHARVVLYLGSPSDWPSASARILQTGGVFIVPSVIETEQIPLTPEQEYLALSLKNAAARLDALLRDEAARAEMSRAAVRKLNGLHSRFWDEVTAAIPPQKDRSLLRSKPAEHIAAPAIRLLSSTPTNPELMAKAADMLARVIATRSADPLAGWMRAEFLALAGKLQEAVNQARQTLSALDAVGDIPPQWLEGVPSPSSSVRLAWERAGWEHAGAPEEEAAAKRAIIRTQLHALLSTLTPDLSHAYEASLGDPKNAALRAELGRALARAGRPAQGIEHLRVAQALQPFSSSARTLHELYVRLGHEAAAKRLRADQNVLREIAPAYVEKDSWFTSGEQTPPLVSIIVLCCGQLSFTRLCLESVLRNTRQPYELILVDNASTDGTADYLRSLASRAGPARVKVIINTENRGFPAGCNQGLAQAEGEYVLFLNNDTIVPTGWLDPLVAVASRHGDGRSLVGPVSNNASPPHPVPVTYRTLDEIELFAERWATEHARKISIVPRLSAFCLLGKRNFVSTLGGFDEGYGIGLFDDDDLCLRAKVAGAELVLVRQVFIHHFGSRTFRDLAVDGQRQLTENFRRFAAKWGPGVAAGYHLPNFPAADAQPVRPEEPCRPHRVPATAPVEQQSSSNQRVSLCMIVKNEESRLAHCLGSVADLVHEIVVADTGSTDRTKEIASQFGAKVVSAPWTDSFAAARNVSIDHATCGWIFWMDADDYLDAQNREKVRTLFGSLRDHNEAYMMRIVSEEAGGSAGKVVDHVRLFRNHPKIRWEYRIHEQILRAVTQAGGREVWSDVVIRHTGYRDKAACHRKHERNLRLLHLEAKDRPDDPFTLFNLGWTYQVLGRQAEAIAHLERGIAIVRPGVSFARKMYAVLINAYRRLGQPGEALKWGRKGLERYPDDDELLYQNAMLSYEAGDLATPERNLRRLLEPRAPSPFAIGVEEGLTGYLARYNLGVIARDLGRLAEAEQLWRAAVAERPEYAAAWVGLAELLASSERWDEIEAMVRKLESEPARRFEALLVHGRGAVGRDTAAALRALERAAAMQPDSIWPPLLRSHVHLQSGNLAAAEQALHIVLNIDPSHHQARTNLDRLLALESAPKTQEAVAPAGYGA